MIVADFCAPKPQTRSGLPAPKLDALVFCYRRISVGSLSA